MDGDDVFGNMDKVRDEETQGSGSAFSDLSALENETDDFGRKLLQHQRDAQRLKTMSGPPRAFSKARTRPRIAQQLEREEREKMAQAERDIQRPGSNGSNDSDPPVTVPREWGRKAKPQKHWMRKIRESPVVSSGDEIEKDEDAIYPRRTSYTGDENPLMGSDMADHPLPSTENTPPSMRRQRPLSTPSSLNHMNTTLKSGGDFEDGDFTAA